MGYYKKNLLAEVTFLVPVGLLRACTMWIETKVSLDKTYLCLNIDEWPNIDAFSRSAKYQTVDMFGLEQG